MSTTKFYLRVAENLRGRTDFRGTLQDYSVGLLRVAGQMHELNITAYDFRVVTGDTVEYTLRDLSQAMAFKLAFAEQIVSEEELEAELKAVQQLVASFNSSLKPTRMDHLLEWLSKVMPWFTLALSGILVTIYIAELMGWIAK